MGDDFNMGAKPAKIVPTAPNALGEYCLGYEIPLNTTHDEFRYAASDLPTTYGSRAVLSPHSGLGTIAFYNKEDMEIASKTTIKINEVRVPGFRIIVYEPRLFRATMRGFKIPMVTKDSIEALVKNIDAAMMAYGVVQDIIINAKERNGKYSILDYAVIIILLNDGIDLPNTVAVDEATVTLSGKWVDAFCMYCKKPGHVLDLCPFCPNDEMDISLQDLWI